MKLSPVDLIPQNNKKEEYSFSKAVSIYQQHSYPISLQMVIKIRLIKPKKCQSQSFYKNSEIKFQTLSNPCLTKFRMRSTPKLIHFKNPWEELDKQQINLLAQRLEDKPKDLYSAIKQNIFDRKKSTRLKFNRLSLNVANIQKIPNQKSLLKINQMIEANKFSKIQIAMRKGFINFEDKFNQSKLMNKINQKRMEYERQIKNMINEKRLILETDLPKINRIKAVIEPNQSFLGRDSKRKLPLGKLR